ncbi:hypothetical protein Peur_029928 [Populus x canadensis]
MAQSFRGSQLCVVLLLLLVIPTMPVPRMFFLPVCWISKAHATTRWGVFQYVLPPFIFSWQAGLRYPGWVPGSHTCTIYSENHLLRNGKGKMESFNCVGGFHQVTVMIVKPMNKHVSVLQKPRMMLAFCHYLYSLLPLMRLCL